MADRIVLILGGGDWADASVDDLIVAEDLDLEKEKEKYDKWYKEVYCSTGVNHQHGVKYQDFPEWLIARCDAEEAGLEEFNDI